MKLLSHKVGVFMSPNSKEVDQALVKILARLWLQQIIAEMKQEQGEANGLIKINAGANR